MPRNKHGWLTAASLKDGERDQFAIIRTDGRHEVELYWDERQQGGFVLQHVRLSPEVREVHVWQVGTNLPLAREEFKKIVRRLGGTG